MPHWAKASLPLPAATYQTVVWVAMPCLPRRTPSNQAAPSRSAPTLPAKPCCAGPSLTEPSQVMANRTRPDRVSPATSCYATSSLVIPRLPRQTQRGRTTPRLPCLPYQAVPCHANPGLSSACQPCTTISEHADLSPSIPACPTTLAGECRALDCRTEPATPGLTTPFQHLLACQAKSGLNLPSRNGPCQPRRTRSCPTTDFPASPAKTKPIMPFTATISQPNHVEPCRS